MALCHIRDVAAYTGVVSTRRSSRTRTPYHRGNTRTDAITAGHELLATDGIQAVTTVAIASRLGVSRAAIARAFPSILDLHEVLAADCLTMLGKALAEAEDAHRTDPIASQWAAIAHAYLAWSRAHPHEYALIFRVAPGAGEQPRPLLEESGEPVPDAFEMGLPPWSGDPARNPAFARWAMLHGLAMLFIEGPLRDLDSQSADRVVDGAVGHLVALLTDAYGETGPSQSVDDDE